MCEAKTHISNYWQNLIYGNETVKELNGRYMIKCKLQLTNIICQ